MYHLSNIYPDVNYSIDTMSVLFSFFFLYNIFKMKYYDFKTFEEMYAWLLDNSKKETELFVKISRQKPEKCIEILSYYDAVKAALCFGWIDSTLRNIDGNLIQRFSPRKKKSNWTETNIKRCIELENAGLMTKQGRDICPYFNNK